MGIEEESVEWVGELGVEDWDAAAEAEERWPEDRRKPNTRLLRASTPRLGAP